MIMFSHSTKKMAQTYKKDGDVDANGERIEHDASWWLANGDLFRAWRLFFCPLEFLHFFQRWQCRDCASSCYAD